MLTLEKEAPRTRLVKVSQAVISCSIISLIQILIQIIHRLKPYSTDWNKFPLQ